MLLLSVLGEEQNKTNTWTVKHQLLNELEV